MSYDDLKGVPLPDDDLVLPRPLTPAQHAEFKQILEAHYKEKISDDEVADIYRRVMTVMLLMGREEAKQLSEDGNED